MHAQLVAILASVTAAYAWLPWELNATRSEEHDKRWLPNGVPSSAKIRGVNLGSQYIVEPWLSHREWDAMGCTGKTSEFDCVSALGQAKANQVWWDHWNRWITEDDFNQMQNLGLNTVRIPIGYWMKEDLVYSDSEHFPQGGWNHLQKVCGWASDRGLYIILDLHGAPGAQVPHNAFTGQNNPSVPPGFYVDYQYNRAIDFLKWMTNNVHTNNALRNVGMLEVVNEPCMGGNGCSPQGSLISSYYKDAWNAIRDVESSLGISGGGHLHIQYMDNRWGAGDPKQGIPDPTNYFAAFDNHRYLKYDGSVTQTQQGYLSKSCSDDLSGNYPVIVGEWSLSPRNQDDAQFQISDSSNAEFYRKWWAAQVMAYEKQAGWVFWSWKSDLKDYRWSYQQAANAGIIPSDPGQAYNMGAC